MVGKAKGERKTVSAARRPKAQKVWVTKMFGIFREEPLREGHSRAWAREFRVECGICESYSLVGSD